MWSRLTKAKKLLRCMNHVDHGSVFVKTPYYAQPVFDSV